MTAVLRTEWRKIMTTRTWWLLALSMFGYMLVMAVIMAASFALAMRAPETASAKRTSRICRPATWSWRAKARTDRSAAITCKAAK